MSGEEKQLSLLDQMKQQHVQFSQQKDLAQNNLNQLVGAIYACEIMIKKMETEEATKLSGDAKNVGLNNEDSGQTP